MTREFPQMKVRLPEDLKATLTAAAKANNRSMNSEIVSRLEGSLVPNRAGPTALGAIETTDLITELVRRFPGEMFAMYIGDKRLGASHENNQK